MSEEDEAGNGGRGASVRGHVGTRGRQRTTRCPGAARRRSLDWMWPGAEGRVNRSRRRPSSCSRSAGLPTELRLPCLIPIAGLQMIPVVKMQLLLIFQLLDSYGCQSL